MADSTTTNLLLTKPEVGASTDSWGNKVNADLDLVDSVFAAAGTGTSVGLNIGSGKKLKLVGDVIDTNGNELLKVTATASAVNEVTLANAATGNAPTMTASGDDTNIGFKLVAKGTGEITAKVNGSDVFNASSSFGFKNRIINGQLNINQRGVSGTVTLTAGSYGHDRFKGGASGCTYTFATSNNVTTLTISAGSLIQVVEGLNLESGTYTLSWTGTVQGKIGAGSFSATGVTGSITGGTNTNIEFNTGTLSLPQLEKGSTATSFDYRDYGTELFLCQRYYETYSNGTGTGSISEGLTAAFPTTGICRGFVPFKVTKRASPTVTVPTTYTTINSTVGNTSPSTGGSSFASSEGASINFTVTAVVAGQACTVGISSSAPITISAEL